MLVTNFPAMPLLRGQKTNFVEAVRAAPGSGLARIRPKDSPEPHHVWWPKLMHSKPPLNE